MTSLFREEPVDLRLHRQALQGSADASLRPTALASAPSGRDPVDSCSMLHPN